MNVTRPKMPPESAAAKRLEKAGAARRTADEELRAAVLAASEAGGSVREIARIGQLSTHTVQAWLNPK